jgi:hypothetical protein
MKTILCFLIVASMTSQVFASNDPVKDFLAGPRPDVRDPGYYASDKVLRLDLDLQGNGQIETLITLNRDRDGKEGNRWAVFKKTDSGYQNVGTMVFSPSRFYLGQIDELGKYGLVTFWPGGGGSGVFVGYVYDRTSVQQQVITRATGEIDPTTGDRKQVKAEKKYLHDKVTQGDSVVKTIDAKELAKKYGLKIESKTYKEALKSGFQGAASQ